MFVRTDMSVEQQLVQASHAALSAGIRDRNTNPQEHCSLVVYQADDEQELLELQKEVENMGFKTTIFFEPYKSTGNTAFITEQLGSEEKIKFKKYSLLGRKKKIILD